MRSLSTAIRNFFQNFLMSIASIISIMATLAILGLALLLVVNLNQLSQQMLQKVDVGTIKVSEDLSKERVSEIEQTLLELDNISSVEYITREEVLQRYIDSLEEEDESLFEGMEERMPSIFEVKIKDTAMMKQTTEELKKISEFTDIRFEQDLTDRMLSISRIVKSVATFIMVALLIITVIIVNNTIRSAITAQSTEISIMRYVGATRSYIRRPFIIESIVFGLLGASLSVVLLYFGYQQVLNFISNQIDFAGQAKLAQDSDILFSIAVLNIIIGVGISLIGSIFSLRRYLKV